jgi:hypothetical protein
MLRCSMRGGVVAVCAAAMWVPHHVRSYSTVQPAGEQVRAALVPNRHGLAPTPRLHRAFRGVRGAPSRSQITNTGRGCGPALRRSARVVRETDQHHEGACGPLMARG